MAQYFSAAAMNQSVLYLMVWITRGIDSQVASGFVLQIAAVTEYNHLRRVSFQPTHVNETASGQRRPRGLSLTSWSEARLASDGRIAYGIGRVRRGVQGWWLLPKLFGQHH